MIKFILAIISLSLLCGCTSQPEIEYVYIPSEPEIIYVDRIVTITVSNDVPVYVEVEKIVKVPDYEPRFFQNDKELIEWLDTLTPPDYGPNQCVKYALWMQAEANADGYQFSTEFEFYGNGEEKHALCSTMIKGIKAKFIEPQTGESWTAGW